uniref:Glycosyltransferase n=1 Tax=viral metagenome TaxID=1070528 RepID=A0A6C0I5K7_9ZZZZ
MNVYIYFHICCINNWANIVTFLYDKIKSSGLYDVVTEIRCGVITAETVSHDLFADKKTRIVFFSTDNTHMEAYTINALFDEANVSDDAVFQVLYLHTKGVRHNGTNKNVTDWTTYMAHFVMDHHELCRQSLDQYDAVGVNLQSVPNLHYSGNFWWSTSKHIRKLRPCNTVVYHAPEFWIGSGEGSYLTVWQSNNNLYEEGYTAEEYEGLPVSPKSIVVKRN